VISLDRLAAEGRQACECNPEFRIYLAVGIHDHHCVILFPGKAAEGPGDRVRLARVVQVDPLKTGRSFVLRDPGGAISAIVGDHDGLGTVVRIPECLEGSDAGADQELLVMGGN
jgi:hypothetical protein